MSPTARRLIPFVGFLSCPKCGHFFHSLQERMNCLPRFGGKRGCCPECETSLEYPRWTCILAVALFFLSLAAAISIAVGILFWPPLQVFVIGLLQNEAVAFPFVVATIVIFAWGMKLKEVEPKNDRDSQSP